jgi:Tfp pilus assembly protein PilO
VRKSRRQIANRVAEAIGLTLVAADLLVFFVVYQPLGNEIVTVERRVEDLRKTIRDQQIRVEVLKKYQDAMPEAKMGVADFMTNRIPPRREAYSIADHLVHKVGDAANVKIMGMAFHLDPDKTDPLLKLGLEVTVQGTYTGMMKFAHGLETANSIILEREFFIAPGTAGVLSLRLGADIYLTP